MDNIFWFGVVEDVNDPKMKGRVKVRIFGVHNPDKKILPTKDLPWSLVCSSPSSAGMGGSPSGLLPGSWCFLTFVDQFSKQIPMVLGTLEGAPGDVVEQDLFEKKERKLRSDNNKGFVDPDKKYPLYPNEPDINRLARNEKIDETIVKTKKDNVIKDIPLTDDLKWQEPETEYDAKYPYNKVTETQSGHIIEYDDTPGKERIHHYHKSGTFDEIYPDGQKVQKIMKDNYELILGDDYLYVKGNANISIEGNVNLYVKGDVIEQINGQKTLNISNSYKIKASNLEIDNDVQINGNLNIKEEMHSKNYDIHTHTCKCGKDEHETTKPNENYE